MDRTRNERESRPKFMACCCDVTAVKCNNEKLMVQKSLVLEQLHAAASVDRQTLTAHDASAQPHASAGRRCQSEKASRRRRRRRRNWRRRRVLFSIAIVPTTALNSSRWSLTSSTRPTSSLAWTHSASSSETFSSSPPFSASFAPSASTSSSSAPCSAVTSS